MQTYNDRKLMSGALGWREETCCFLYANCGDGFLGLSTYQILQLFTSTMYNFIHSGWKERLQCSWPN